MKSSRARVSSWMSVKTGSRRLSCVSPASERRQSEQREQAREAVEDLRHVFAEVFRRQPVREPDELLMKFSGAGRMARGEDEPRGLRAPQLALEDAAQTRPRGEADRVRFEQRVAQAAHVLEDFAQVGERLLRTDEAERPAAAAGSVTSGTGTAAVRLRAAAARHGARASRAGEAAHEHVAYGARLALEAALAQSGAFHVGQGMVSRLKKLRSARSHTASSCAGGKAPGEMRCWDSAFTPVRPRRRACELRGRILE